MIEPTKFIVRNPNYFQDAAYTQFCARVTQELLDHPPYNPNELVERVSKYMKAFQEKHPSGMEIYNRMKGDWGVVRNREDYLQTTFRNHKRYYLAWQQLSEDHPDTITESANEDIISIKTPAESDPEKEPIDLSLIDNIEVKGRKFRGNLIHTNLDQKNNERLWADISLMYKNAMDESKDKPERKTAALKCYALLCHDATYARGSATLSRIALEFMAQHIGFEVPFTKWDIDLNTQALITTPSIFVERYENGDYFDSNATPRKVEDWQNSVISFQQNILAQNKPITMLGDYLVAHRRSEIRQLPEPIQKLLTGQNPAGMKAEVKILKHVGYIVDFKTHPSARPQCSENPTADEIAEYKQHKADYEKERADFIHELLEAALGKSITPEKTSKISIQDNMIAFSTIPIMPSKASLIRNPNKNSGTSREL